MNIKPCPLCNSAAVRSRENGIGYNVICDDCGTEGPTKWMSSDAVAAWNYRPRENDLEGEKKRLSSTIRAAESFISNLNEEECIPSSMHDQYRAFYDKYRAAMEAKR